jgi:hypothetical protein
MTDAEYSLLFHKAGVNRVAFKQVNHCDAELKKMVEIAVKEEREACAKTCENIENLTLGGEDVPAYMYYEAIRNRGEE